MLARVEGARAAGRLKRILAVTLAFTCTFGCANTKFNTIAPGNERPEGVRVPDAVDLDAAGFAVHLDPTVMLWARDARVDLREIVDEALTTVAQDLQGPRAQVSISAGSYRVIPDVGIGGSTDTKTGEVLVSMDSRSPLGLRRLLKTWLPLALAHELHHSKRILQGPGYGTTLLDTLIAEGGAEAFVRETYPNAPPIPWVRPPSKKAEERVWREADGQLDRPDDADVYERWFLGKSDLPRWTGYRLGYAIVTAYLERHPDTDAADVAILPSAEVLEQSGYDPS
jgi:predicted Zn-dependent protease DUF2268